MHRLFSPPALQKNNSVQPSFETPTDTMTVSLNVGRVRRDVSLCCYSVKTEPNAIEKIYIAALKLHDFTQRFRLVIPQSVNS